MSHDDPFATPDPDGTTVMPRLRSRAAPPPAPQATHEPRLAAIEPGPTPSGISPLVAAANPLLDLVPQLRASTSHPDPQALRDQLTLRIREFEARARASGVPPEQVIAARYVLCTLLDEVAASTPWGGSGAWARRSLLVAFHNETWGGEKFFQLLAKLAEHPAANIDLLQLLYICLALGFGGRYRVVENGRQQLDSVRERLAQLVRRSQAEYERDLSPRWRGAAVKRNPVLAVLPLWVVFAGCGIVLLGTYLWLNARLNGISDPVFARIHAVRAKTLTPRAEPRPAAPKPRLAQFLAPEVQAGLVGVADESTRSIVTIRGDGLFPPGSSMVRPEVLPILGRIAAALQAVPGQVVVTGHTDNRPIRSARFPSNWQLSQERAQLVALLLAERGVPRERMRSEGRGDAQPIAANDTPGDRAQNRRVEITLLLPRAE